jgi:hypothetical protein
VAAALHNVGIAQLRAQNYAEALKAFEEAARIRKGALGREHPQVAVSLALLLHPEPFRQLTHYYREYLLYRYLL